MIIVAEYLEYRNTTVEKYKMHRSNDTLYQHHYHYEKCPSCKIPHMISWIGDGECDIDLDNTDCCFDGGDCNEKKYLLKFFTSTFPFFR